MILATMEQTPSGGRLVGSSFVRRGGDSQTDPDSASPEVDFFARTESSKQVTGRCPAVLMPPVCQPVEFDKKNEHRCNAVVKRRKIRRSAKSRPLDPVAALGGRCLPRATVDWCSRRRTPGGAV